MAKHARTATGASGIRSRATDDPYALLDVSPDASDSQIRTAYERALNRAHRIGALQLATDITRAYDTVSTPRRREIFERHGMRPLREDPRRASLRFAPVADLRPSEAAELSRSRGLVPEVAAPGTRPVRPSRARSWRAMQPVSSRPSPPPVGGLTWWAVGLLCGVVATIALLASVGELSTIG